MVNEQIKIEISRQIDERFKKDLNLLTLPFIAQYRIYSFAGIATGALTPLFNIQDLQGRFLIIKAIRIDYYAEGDAAFADIGFSDGTDERLNDKSRINRIFDIWDVSPVFDMRINGTPVGIFGNTAAGVGYPADLNIDNIFYKFPEKVNDWTFAITAQLFSNPSVDIGAIAATPNVKATIECYII